MNQHVHYDIVAFEKQMREQFASDAAQAVDEFHRLQFLGSEVVIQFGVYLAKLDNEGVSHDDAVNAAAAIIASQIENLAASVDADRGETIFSLLQIIARFSFRGGEVLSTSEAPVVPGGRA